MGQTEIEPALAGTVVLLSAGLMLAGGLIPSISIQKISDTFNHIFQSDKSQTLAESLGLQQTPQVAPKGIGSNNIGLSDTHAVGPGPQLSQQVMMTVAVDGYVPPPPAEVLIHTNLPPPTLRFYWRGETYDTYNGHVWIANTSFSRAVQPDKPYHPDLTTQPDNYQVVHQQVDILQPMDQAVYAAGELLTIDQPSTADWRTSGDLVDARTTAVNYSAESRIQLVSVEQLRHAGTDYSVSMQTFMALPDELPTRVRDLAVRLTIDQPTPYDQVMAIQTYLRQFPYTLQVPGSPTDRDVADYFLFDLQKGYCDYFATTMAVMVRAVGIPSRLVTGFSTGTYDYKTGRFIIVEANAHSWVEVYFPGIGWVEFEPTTNQLPFYHPGETTIENTPNLTIPIPPKPPVENVPFWTNLANIRLPLVYLEYVLSTLAILLIGWLVLPVESWWLAFRPVEKAIPFIYRRLYKQGQSWGVPADAARTPHEFADAFAGKMERFSRNPRSAVLIPTLQSDLVWLTDVYTRLLFSKKPLDRAQHQTAISNWARIRRNLRKIRDS